MRIALLGYGKMGQEIEKIALERNHEIVLKITEFNLGDLTVENLKKADVAIEFSTPESAVANINRCFEANIPVVSGTTGWLDKMVEIKKRCIEQGQAFFYASNYSVGVNIFFMLNKHLAKLMNNHKEYDVEMEEIHHTQKLDAPSGTAITLAEGILEKLERKTSWVSKRGNEVISSKPEDLIIMALREEKVPGTHTVTYKSDVDSISITHEAFSRKGFASGAVLASEWIIGKKGIFGMSDMLSLTEN